MRTDPLRTGAPSPVAAIVAANLRRQLRDRTGLFFLIVMPFVVITLVGFALGGRSGGERVPVGVVATGDGAGTAALLQRLAAAPDLEVVPVDDAAALRDGVRQGRFAAGLVLPPGLDASPPPPALLLEFVEPPGGQAGAAARGAVQAVVSAEAGQREALRSALGTGADPARAEALVADATAVTRPITVTATALDGGDATPTGFAYTSPANLVLFTFINSMAVAGALVETRRLGISRRALAAPVRPGAVLLGEAVSRFLVAALQAGLIVVGSSLLFGVRWGDPWATGAVLAVFCLVATGAAMLVGSLLRSGSQASAVGPPIGIVLGMLGGCLWPADVGGPVLAAVGHVFPHAWAMDALLVLSGPGRGLTDVLLPLLVLAAMAAVLLGAALLLFRRSMLRGVTT